MIGLTLSALISLSSMIAKFTSGLAFAAFSVASFSRKPTVTTRLQFASTMLWMFGAKSFSLFDSALLYFTPREPAACWRPS